MMEKQDGDTWTSQALSGSDKGSASYVSEDDLKNYITVTAAADPVPPGFLSPTGGSSEKEQEEEAKTREEEHKNKEEQKFTDAGKKKLEDSKKPANQKNADKKQQKDKINLTKQLNEKARDIATGRAAELTSEHNLTTVLEGLARSGKQGNEHAQNIRSKIESEVSEIANLSRQVASGSSLDAKIKQDLNQINQLTDKELKIISHTQNHAHPKEAISGEEAGKALREQAKREGAKNHPTPIPMNPEMNKQKDSKAVTGL